MYKRIRDLCAPAKPKNKSFHEIVTFFKEYLIPKKNVAMERCNFQQAKQAANESIANFVERLKTLLLHCNYGDQLKNNLRDQLVCGIYNHDTRVALFSETNFTYDSAVQLAATREAAVRNAANARKVSG